MSSGGDAGGVAVPSQHPTSLARQQSVRTIGQFLDEIDEDLLSRLDDPATPAEERSQIIAEIRGRITGLGRFLRLATKRKEQLRRAVLRLVDPGFSSPPVWRAAANIDLAAPDGIKAWSEHEEEQNMAVFSYLESYVSWLELHLTKLRGELTVSQQERVVRSAWKTDGGGAKVYVETEEAPPCQENFIHVPKQDMVTIIKVLKPHRKCKAPTAANESLQTASEMLKEQILNIADQVERVKERLQQTTERIAHLENEKGTVYAALQETDLERALPDVVLPQIRALTADNAALRGEVAALRRRVEEAEQDTTKVSAKMNASTKDAPSKTSKKATNGKRSSISNQGNKPPPRRGSGAAGGDGVKSVRRGSSN